MKTVLETPKVTYRQATVADLGELFPFFLQIPRENQITDSLETDQVKGLETLKVALESPDSACLVATVPHPAKRRNGIIVGAILLSKTTVWWSSTVFFTNVAFYVLPSYRKGFGIQRDLINACKNFTDSTGTPLVVDIFDGTDRTYLKARYFEQRGFKNLGFKMAYLPKDGS